MPVTPESLRADLGEIAHAESRVAASDLKLQEASEHRREAVQARLDELRPKALTDAAAGDEYQALVSERGRLDVAGGRDNTVGE